MVAIWRVVVTACTGVAAGALAAQALPPVQQTGQDAGPDILVEGGVPRMIAGQWRFTMSPALTDPVAGRPLPRAMRGQVWERCIDQDDTAAIIDAMIGEEASFDGAQGCSRLGITMHGARLSGGRRCSRGTAIGLADTTTSISGRIARERLTLDYRRQTTIGGQSGPKTRWQVVAVRTGSCAVPPPPGDPPPVARVAPMAAPELELVHGSGARAPNAVAAPAATADAGADDILVVARKLRRIRLHYASTGRILRWCHADISSGDPRLDRIGCALVRACVKEGNEGDPDVLACVHARVDSLDSVTGPLPRPEGRGG